MSANLSSIAQSVLSVAGPSTSRLIDTTVSLYDDEASFRSVQEGEYFRGQIELLGDGIGVTADEGRSAIVELIIDRFRTKARSEVELVVREALDRNPVDNTDNSARGMAEDVVERLITRYHLTDLVQSIAARG